SRDSKEKMLLNYPSIVPPNMKRDSKWRLVPTLLLTGAAMLGAAKAATTEVTTFDSFTPNALYASWSSATINSTPTNYAVTATGYGSFWKQLGPPPVSAAGYSNLVLDVTLDGTSLADTNLGVLVDLIDGDGTEIDYRFYGRSRGHHIIVCNLFTTN